MNEVSTRVTAFALAVLVLFVPVLATAQVFMVVAAGKFDGSTPLLCVPVTVSECRAEGQCRRVTADGVNLPEFLEVDIKARKVSSEKSARTAPITAVDHVNGNVVVQGAQDGRGWTMAIFEETGRMSAAISSSAEGWVVFGDCMLLPSR